MSVYYSDKLLMFFLQDSLKLNQIKIIIIYIIILNYPHLYTQEWNDDSHQTHDHALPTSISMSPAA